MKIECLREKLNISIGYAEKITSKNATLPILKCLLLEASQNTLKVRATNLELGILITIPVKVIEEGTIAIPGNILNSFISNIGGEKNITLETIDGNLKVSTSGTETIIKAYPHDDYPTLPSIASDHSFTLKAKDFIQGLKSVWYSSAISSIKPELSSIFIYPEDDFLIFVATDSFRLAEKKIKVKTKKEFDQILIPFKNVPDIIRVLEGCEGEVDVALDKNQISFSYDGVYLVSRIIDGAFPAYKQIIPKESKTEITALKQDILNSLKTATIFSDSFNRVTISIDPSKKIFELKTKNNDVGENKNNIKAVLEGEPIEINFNYKNIHDCFQSITSDSVLMNFNGLNKALIIKGVNDPSFFYLVMPMNK